MLVAALAYAVYSIGRGALGIAMEHSTATRFVIALCFLLVLAGAGFAAYRIIKGEDEDKKKSEDEDKGEAQGMIGAQDKIRDQDENQGKDE